MPSKIDPIEYRNAVEACKDRILVNVILMRQEFPYLFAADRGDMRGLLHTDIIDGPVMEHPVQDINIDEFDLGGL